MSITPKSQQTGQNKAWWSQDNEASLKARVDKISRINDPGTNADEVLFYTNILIGLLLAYSGLLGFMSYKENFGATFPMPVALFMSFALVAAIEWGKNQATTWAIRIPFFQGLRHIVSHPAHTIMFLGLLAIAAGTFTWSVINSTRGGEQLAHLLTTKRDTSGVFHADTRDIDQQIEATQANITEARTTKWRGTTTTTSQRTILEAQKSLTTLSQQREATIAQQRSDWETQQAKKAQNDDYAAGLVLASGGWVELIFCLLIFVKVSCEKILDNRHNPSAAPTPSPEAGIGYRRAATPSTALPSYSDQPPIPTEPTAPPRRPIGFLRDREVDLPEARAAAPEQPTVPATVPPKIVVEQREQAEQPVPSTPETAAILADVKEWKKRCTQCFHRACNQQREEFRRANRLRTTCYATMLEAIGFRCSIIFDTLYIQIQEPTAYNISEQAIKTIQEQKLLLEQIGKEGRV